MLFNGPFDYRSAWQAVRREERSSALDWHEFDNNLVNAFRLWDYDNAMKRGAKSEEQRRLEAQEAQFLGGSNRGGERRKTDADLIKETLFADMGGNIL